VAGRRASWHQEQQQEAEVPIAFGDLEVHRQVGSGQFGVVRLVRHVPTGRLYALKVNDVAADAICSLFARRVARACTMEASVWITRVWCQPACCSGGVASAVSVPSPTLETTFGGSAETSANRRQM
jgi:hypothetical protein